MQKQSDMEKDLKQLLLKDLCARLPYGVKGWWTPKHLEVIKPKIRELTPSDLSLFDIGKFKPYLRPMSSMTEEENEEWNSYVSVSYGKSIRRTPYCIKYMDWLLEHHFDFRHLIEKGLALESPEEMYETK